MKWLLEHNADVRRAEEEGNLRLGTIDSWILYNLTGKHLTDVTNAHRTCLLDLKSLKWNDGLFDVFKVNRWCFPKVQTCSGEFGRMQMGPLEGVPVTGVIGDQHASLVGRDCTSLGSAKNTYGTGCFFLCNTGTRPIMNNAGLLTTVAYQLGSDAEPSYAIEASLAVGGSAFEWTKNNLGLVSDINDMDTIAAEGSDGVLFIPALAGYLAPRWDPDASGALLGLRLHHDRSHLIKAMMNAIAFACREVIDLSMQPIRSLVVDGGLASSNKLMQTQADVLKIPIVRPQFKEATIFGAAKVAAIGAGFKDWPSLDEPPVPEVFYPHKDMAETSELEYAKWKAAIANKSY